MPAAAAPKQALLGAAGTNNPSRAVGTGRSFLSKKALREGWVELVGRYEWDWFVTMTFPDAVHPEQADKLWRTWKSKLNRRVFGPRWHKSASGGVFWVRAGELQRRGVLHYHGLIAGSTDLNLSASRLEWKEIWLDLSGGYSRIFAVENEAAAVRYVCKYVVKGGDVDIGDNLKHYARQRAFQGH